MADNNNAAIALGKEAEKRKKIKEREAALRKVDAALASGIIQRGKSSGPMTANERKTKEAQRDRLDLQLRQLQGLAPKASRSRSRSSKGAQMNENLAAGTLYCYKATPEGKRGAVLDGALIGDDYVPASVLQKRWGKKTALKPTASRAPSRAATAASTRAPSPTGGPGHEGGARRRTMRRKASRKNRTARRKASRKASRKARKSMRRSRKH
jgi:hypothetical protein